MPKVVQSTSRGYRILNPDDVVKWFGENKDSGRQPDGYPRTIAQAETLDKDLAAMGLEVDLNTSLELIQARMLKRKACPACGETTRNGEETCPKCGGIGGLHRTTVLQANLVGSFPTKVSATTPRILLSTASS